MQILCHTAYGLLRSCVLAFPSFGAFRHLIEAPGVYMFQSMPDWDKLNAEMAAYRDFLISKDVYVHVMNYDKFPNQLFMRDLGVVVGETFYLCNPYNAVRRGEEDVLLRNFVRPNNIKYCPLPGTIEGADVLVGPMNIYVQTGTRTSNKAAAQLMKLSKRQLVKSRAPSVSIPQHLSGHKQIVDSNTIIIRSEIDDNTFGFPHVIRLKETDEVVSKFAANILVLGARMIVMPAGCPETKAVYESHCLTVYEVQMDEAHKMGGGLNCITLPLVRM